MALTLADIAIALRISADGADIPQAQQNVLTRLQGVAEAHIDIKAPEAPDAVRDESIIRMVGYLYDSPTASRRDSFANAFVNSGAGALLTHWIPQAVSGSVGGVGSVGSVGSVGAVGPQGERGAVGPQGNAGRAGEDRTGEARDRTRLARLARKARALRRCWPARQWRPSGWRCEARLARLDRLARKVKRAQWGAEGRTGPAERGNAGEAGARGWPGWTRKVKGAREAMLAREAKRALRETPARRAGPGRVVKRALRETLARRALRATSGAKPMSRTQNSISTLTAGIRP